MGELIVNPGGVKYLQNQISNVASDVAYVIDGNKSSTAVASGKYVVLINSTISGRANGAYKAAKAIPANTVLDSSYLTAVSGGITNELNNKIANLVFVETHSENFTGGDGTKKEINVEFDNPHPGYSAHVIAVTSNAYDQNNNIYSYTQYSVQGKIAVYVEHNLKSSSNSLSFRVLYIKS